MQNEQTIDSLTVQTYQDRVSLGQAAADTATGCLRRALQEKSAARIIVASAPSQDEMLAALTAAPDIDWSRIEVFHMDEYVGLDADHPASFRAYQKSHLLSRVQPMAFHGLRGEAPDLEAECRRYTESLQKAPIDLVCMGIGENGHIAFNDPPVADFNDTEWVKQVELDEACRQQQVNDGCFPTIEAVPRFALSLTCPALMSGAALVCVVPGALKAEAVRTTCRGPITEACPASVLRRHPAATLFLDTESAALL